MTLFPKFSKRLEFQKDGKKIIQEQKLLQTVNNLILNADVCTGCGVCIEACPEEAIVMSDEYELVFSKPEEAIFEKDRLLMSTDRLKTRLEFLRQAR